MFHWLYASVRFTASAADILKVQVLTPERHIPGAQSESRGALFFLGILSKYRTHLLESIYPPLAVQHASPSIFPAFLSDQIDHAIAIRSSLDPPFSANSGSNAFLGRLVEALLNPFGFSSHRVTQVLASATLPRHTLTFWVLWKCFSVVSGEQLSYPLYSADPSLVD